MNIPLSRHRTIAVVTAVTVAAALLVVPIDAAPGLPRVPAAPMTVGSATIAAFQGTFRGAGATLTLRFDAATERFIGALTEGGQSVPVDVKVVGGGLAGAIVEGTVIRRVTISRTGGGVVVRRGDRPTVLTRVERTPPTGPDPASTSNTTASSNAAATAAPVGIGPVGSALFAGAGIEFPAFPQQPAPQQPTPQQPTPQQPAPAPPTPQQPAAAPAAAAPPFVKPGMRLLYSMGSSSAPVAGSKDGPTGATGYQQLTITDVRDGVAAAEVRVLGLDLNERAVRTTSTTTYLLPLEQGGEYWISPRKLAAMNDGTQGGVTTQRLSYPLDGTTYRAIRLTTPSTTGSSQYTYDLDSGMLIVWGYESTGKEGTRYLANLRFAGMRQTTLPWTGQQVGQAVLGLTRADWSGTYTTAVDGAYTVTYRISQRWDVTKADPLAVQIRQTDLIDYGDGRAATPSTSTRVLPIPSVWIDPTVLATLRPGQVLDDDRTTGLKLVVAGQQGGAVVLVEQGAIQVGASAYDLRSGLLTAVQVQQRAAPGTTTVFLKRTA